MELEMEHNLSDQVRLRAYGIWIASGYRDGEAEEHWLTAEREILSALQTAVVEKPSGKRTKHRAASKAGNTIKV